MKKKNLKKISINEFREVINPAFTLKLQEQGIFGAIRVQGSPDVYTIGKGGGLETPESFKSKFGTLSQSGIVDIVSQEQATSLGVKSSGLLSEKPGSLTLDIMSESNLNLPDEPSFKLVIPNLVKNLEYDFIKREYNSRLASFEAKMAKEIAIKLTKQGDFQLAKQFVGEAVNASIFEYTRDLKMLEDFINDNRDVIATLDKKYQDALDDILKSKESELTEAKEDKQMIIDLIIKKAETNMPKGKGYKKKRKK